MRFVVGLVVVALVLASGAPAFAQALDAASSAALDAVLSMLLDPAQRSAAIAGNPQAAAADRQMQEMLRTPEMQQEFYTLAGAIFAELVQRSGGDVGKMGQALDASRSNPAGLIESLSPATREQLRVLAAKIAEQKR
jgi:hypothetical protein